MGEWVETTLDQVVRLKRGFDLPEPERVPGPFPVLGSSGVSGWHNEGPISGPGVTIGRSGASIGVATYWSGTYWPLNTTLFVEDFCGNDPRYIYYLLHNIDFRSYNSGSAQPSLNRNYIANVRVSLPKLGEQQAIAAVLGALDDKIAVNERIADCSHRLALLRYSEATVGYKSVPLSSLVDPILGGTPDRKVSEYWGPGVPWASAKDVAACQYGTLITTAEEITAVAVTGSKRFRPVPKGAVLLTARGTVGAVARVCQETSLNQSCYAMLPRTVPSAVLYLTVLSAVDQMLNVAHGSVFSTLNMKSFDHLQAPALSSSELDRLESIVAPLLEQVELRLRENQSLAQLRDTLLPKLMSGELRVRDAERMVEDAT